MTLRIDQTVRNKSVWFYYLVSLQSTINTTGICRGW